MPRIATIGFFDGVHLGHRFLFEQLQRIAAERALRPLIVTFDAHPREVLQRGFVPQLLTTLEERKTLLSAFGEVLVLPFAQIKDLTAAQFMQRLANEQEVTTLLMGYDHRFGSDKLVDPQDYARLGQQCGIEVLTLGEYSDGAIHVSSTEIRQAIERGDIATANRLLGRPYTLTGTVVHGKGIGRTIDFPTANIVAQPTKILPKAGVYEVRVKGAENTDRAAILNIGTNPTVGNSEQTIEVHIPSFSGNLYGHTLTIDFLRYIRAEKRFENLEALKAQIQSDVDSIRHPA